MPARFDVTAAVNLAASTWQGLLRLIYPNTCAGCGEPAADDALPLCVSCWRRLERADPSAVARQLGRLPLEPGAVERAFVMWTLEAGSALRRIHHLLKYGNRPRCGTVLGRIIGDALRTEFPSSRPDFVVPVPLHRVRHYERGYNQSAMLAHGIAEVLNVPMREDLLLRLRATRTQTKLSREERWSNVQGAFTVPDPEQVTGRRVLLVDDVLTTGATTAAAALALRAAGAADVTIAALAFAQT